MLIQGGTLKSDAVFEGMIAQLKSRKDIAKKIGAVFGWVITKEGKEVAEWSRCLLLLTPSQTTNFRLYQTE